MDALLAPLKQEAKARRIRWQLVSCGSRNATFRAFRNASRSGRHSFAVLLVDSEGPVQGDPKGHLAARDGWSLGFTTEDAVHLMVQVMETWIVADADALAAYYGSDFSERALPRTQNLEDVRKDEIERALNRATERTSKGRYQKIRHASDLLQRIDVEMVKRRCRHCERLFEAIQAAL